ncbi:retrovirus-related pol polyprotein from transposon TNT 1-94 [Tanacetum coccineum]
MMNTGKISSYIVNTKEYHSECSGKYHYDICVGLLITACDPMIVQQVFEMECVLTNFDDLFALDSISAFVLVLEAGAVCHHIQYQQLRRLNFEESFAPVARLGSISSDFRAARAHKFYVAQPEVSLTQQGSPESSKAKESDNSPDASNSESSSSCSETFKPFDNYVPVTERVLHEEAIASYADLKWSIKDFHATTFQKYKNTNVALKNYQKIITQFKFDHVEGLKRILTNLQEVQNVVKEDPALNKKVFEAAEAYTKNSTNLIELFTLVKNFHFLGFKTNVDSLQAVVTAKIESDFASLKTHTADIKAMMTEMFCAFKGQSFFAPSSSVPEPTLALTRVPTNVGGEFITHYNYQSFYSNIPKHQSPEEGVTELLTRLITKDGGSSHTTPKDNKGKDIARDTDDSPRKIVKALKEAYLKKEEQMQKAAQETRLIALSKPELIKMVEEVASEARVDLKALRCSKGGHEFLMKQDAEFNPFRFSDFGVTEWDELSVIIPKKKNKVVGELMESLSKKYERLKEILGELGINPTEVCAKAIHPTKMKIEDYMYQKKLYEPLAKAKPIGMKAKDWTLLDRQALGVVRLSLAKNVAYNVVKEKTTHRLIKDMFNMSEKPSASNKVYLIWQLVNTKVKEGASVADHVNEFNSILARLVSVEIKFDDEKTEAGAKSKTKGRSSRTEVGRSQRGEPIVSKDKEVNMAAEEFDDVFVCCIENTIEDLIMDSNASFHAIYCKEELERNTRKLQRLELVHTHAYGPTSAVSIGGSRYYVTFIDDSIRKCLKSDNSKEYSSQEFIEYCVENGIKMLKTVPEIPQQKGVAERMNHALNERAKSMRLHAGPPKLIWADAVNTTAYLINRRPFVPLGFHILEKEWQGKAEVGTQIQVRDMKAVGALTVEGTEVQYSPSDYYLLLSENGELESYSEALNYQHERRYYRASGCSGLTKSRMAAEVSWERRKPRVQVEEESVRIEASTKTTVLEVDSFMFDMENINKFKMQLSQEFEMKDIGSAKQILGMSIIKNKTESTLRLSHEKYIGKVLEMFNMKDVEARCQPLGYHFKLSKKQAPKTEAARQRMAKKGTLRGSQVAATPLERHLEAYPLFSRKDVVLEGSSDSDYVGYLDLGKSTKGYVFTVGHTKISWMSRIQKCVAMSTTEAEYMVVAEAGKELVWLKNFLEELDRAQTESILYYDNQSAIYLTKNLVCSKVVTTDKLKLCAASLDSDITNEQSLVLNQRERMVRAVALLKGRWFEVYKDY